MDIFMASTQLKARASDVIKRVADFCYWPILLQKSVETGRKP